MSTDVPNPFQTPTAELASAAPVKLYSLAAVGLAAFFGTPLAAAYVMSHNLRALGRAGEVRKVWVLSVLLTAGVFALGMVLPDNVPGIGFVVAQILIMRAYAKQLFGTALDEHKAQVRPFLSNWRAFGVSLLFMLAFLVVVFAAVWIIEPSEGEMNTLQGPVSVEQ